MLVSMEENNAVVLKTVAICNINDVTTEESLMTTLALDASPFLCAKSTIRITNDDLGVRTAHVTTLEHVIPHLIALNDKMVEGKQWSVSEVAAPAPAPPPLPSTAIPSSNNDTPPEATNNEGNNDPPPDDIQYMIIDCRNFAWVWNQVGIVEVIAALQIDHEEDFSKSVGRLKPGLWSLDSDDFQRYIGKSIKVRGHDIQLKPKYRPRRREPGPDGATYVMGRGGRSGRREGTLVTIFGAYKRHHRNISGELFDQVFQAIEGLDVIKQTQPQKTKGTTVLNNNRFLVVKSNSTDKLDIGSSIHVMGIRFNIVYDGMEKFCHLCNCKHGAGCPVKLRFDLLKQLRQGTTGKRKIYSTSVLAHVNQLALTTDVTCMSGGGIGQLCNVIPTDDKHEQVIILAGSNEIKNSPPAEFVYTIDKTVEKLRTLAATSSVTVVLPLTPVVGAEETAKAQYIEEKFRSIDEVSVVQLDAAPVDFSDDVHPSQKGTEEIIRQLNDVFEKEIVLEDATSDDLTTPARYSKVQSIFKAGCRACPSTDFCSYLCEDCKAAAADTDTSQLQDMIEVINSREYPNLGDSDIYMMDQSALSKRKRDEISGDNSGEDDNENGRTKKSS